MKSHSRNGKPNHGYSHSTTYLSWWNARTRCFNRNSKKWPRYGGRGIVMCAEWSDFREFLKDMGEKPTRNHTLDRIDNNGNYCKDNCRWTTQKEQQNNRADNVIIEIDGVSRKVFEWSLLTGIPQERICERINYGWTPRDAAFRPLRKSGKPHDPTSRRSLALARSIKVT